MKKAIKDIIKKTPLFPLLRPMADYLKGSPALDSVKRQTLKEYGTKYDLSCFVETGTYLGDTVEAMKQDFSKIYSIELDQKLADEAGARFKDESKITIVQGDSAKLLPKILAEISQPTLFWLDGHYSAGFTAKADKETPVMEELSCIFNWPNSNWVVLIDDARCFRGEHDYPTLKNLKKFVLEKIPGAIFEVKNDMIRIIRGAA